MGSGVEKVLQARHLEAKKVRSVEKVAQRLPTVEDGECVGQNAARLGQAGQLASENLVVVLERQSLNYCRRLESLPVLRHLANRVLDWGASSLVDGVFGHERGWPQFTSCHRARVCLARR